MSTVKVSERKKAIVEKLKNELSSYPIIGLVKIDNIGARVVQKIRAELRKDAKIVMAKNTLMRKAIMDLKDKIQGIEKLLPHIEGPCAFILTHKNPFKLATYLDKNKVPAPAKAGQVAPNDIVIQPMNTGIPPGPVISELQSLGLKTRIEGGQIRIVEPATITKAGERVNRTVALLLRRLNIDPFEAGLKLTVAFENGEIIPGDVLVINYEEFEQRIQHAYNRALNLAVNAGILNKVSLPLIIANVYNNAMNLAVNSTIINSRSLPIIISKALFQGLSIAAKVAELNSEFVSPKMQEKLSMITTQTIVKEQPSTTKEKPEEKEDTEEEEDLGLGALFG